MTAQSTTNGFDRATGGRPVVPRVGGRRGLGLGEITLAGGFWDERQRINREATLGHCLDWMERLGWLASFDRVATGTTGPNRPGWQFSDSEVYKLMEALAWEHGRTGDRTVGELLNRLTERVARAQDADGYLNTCFGHAGQRGRYTDLEMGHELYCTGHLLQAAVARVRTYGEDLLVDVARRAAEHVCAEFGPDGRVGICGHPEIELGLAELGRALGEPRFTEQARVFVERRGHGLLGPVPLQAPAYFQDDVPVREADVWRGHTVRALYLSAAAVDVAVDTGDDELLAAVERQWDRSVERRTYLTGGMGSRHQDEGFGDDWELPSDRAYCETCAGVASVMVSWRLYLATGDVRYADLIERTFYNVVATSPRSDGRAFFYANPLHQRVPGVEMSPCTENPRAEGGTRAPWFDVSCCPTNVARTLATWQTYAVAVEPGTGPGAPDVVTLLQHASCDLRIELAAGPLELRVRTAYPADGRIDVEVVTAPEAPVELRLRVPAWAEGATLTDRDHTLPVAPGFAGTTRVWTAGDRLVLDLPTTPRLTWPDPRIDAVRGCVAVERGPLVLCLESVDLPADGSVEEVQVDVRAPIEVEGDGARVRAVLVAPTPGSAGALPYDGAPGSRAGTPLLLTLVPYHRWAERGPSAMRVFLPVSTPARVTPDE